MRVVLFALCLTLQAQDPALLKEIAMGRQLANELRRTTPPVESPAIQDYVARLGATLAAQLPDRGVPYSFSAVQGWTSDEPQVLPGGYVFVPLRLFSTTNDEAEFAAVLAQATVRAENLMVDASGVYLTLTYGSQPMVPVRMIPRLRTLALKADAASIPVLAAAGFDPTALLRYVERSSPAKGILGQQFSTVPPREERVAALREALSNVPPTMSESSAAFTEIQQQVRSQPGPDARPSLKRQPSNGTRPR